MKTHVVLLLFFASTAATMDPEAYMTVMELIRYWGYPAELHDVLTADGYILSLFRIPHGRFSSANSSCARPPVIMAHGLGGGSGHYLLNPPASCPALILADAGFDVFILGVRGTTYSKRHITLKPWDNKFWQFTIDEMAKYDVPAVIDKVLSVTGQSGTYWVGHSQGTAVGFMTLAETPAYNKKVKGLFQIGPTATAGHMKGLIQIALFAYRSLKPILDLYRNALGSHEVLWFVGFFSRQWSRLLVSAKFIHPSRLPVYASHNPAGTSTWNALHWGQLATRGRADHMDHNPLENIQRYGQETPTPYDYSLIDAPVYLIWSRNDWLTTMYELEYNILRMLRKETVKGGLEVPEYNHLDYVVATDCAEKVFNPISEIVRNEEKDMCER